MKTSSSSVDLHTVLPILSKISFLGGVSDEQRPTLFRYFETAYLAKGECIGRVGEVTSHIYIIKSGRINLRITGNGECLTKRVFHVGDCFGEAAFLSMINNAASFVAAEDCELITLSRSALNHLRLENPDLFCILIMNLARELARKLQYTDEMLLKLNPGAELHP